MRGRTLHIRRQKWPRVILVRYELQNYTLTLAPGTLTVTKATPAFSSLSAPQVKSNSSTTLSGTLLAPSGSKGTAPTGSVTITVAGISHTAAVGSNGKFSASFSFGTLSSSSYTITYSYAGDSNYAALTATTTLTVTGNSGHAKTKSVVIAPTTFSVVPILNTLNLAVED